MGIPFLVAILSVLQASGGRTPQDPHVDFKVVFDRVSKEANLDGAALILSSVLSNESATRAAFSTPVVLDERTVYILYGGNWGSRARLTWEERLQRHRIRVESTSTKPELIRLVLRASRYETYFRSRTPGGAATINSFPFFEGLPDADDLVAASIESLRKGATHPAEAVISMDNFVLVTAEDMEVNLLAGWQMLCGVCDRLDLIDKATTKNWRARFPELDQWFQKNRPYILWDNRKSCIRIDEDAKRSGSPVPRTSKSIPELKPPWLSENALNVPATP